MLGLRVTEMSHQKPDQGESVERPSGLVRIAGQHGARSGERHRKVSISLCSVVLRIAKFATPKFATLKFAMLCALALVGWGAEMPRAQVSDAEKAGYADALAYCRGFVGPPMVLRSDKRVLCLDGLITAPLDLWTANGLEPGGLFVVRGYGGDIADTISLADTLLTKGATVIVNDYCLAACADYLFIASAKTFVAKGGLVAWINQLKGPRDCIGLLETSDPTAPRLQGAPCAGPFFDYARSWEPLKLRDKFYKGRIFEPPFVQPPESVAVRRILKRKFDATGRYPANIYWTWNPRFYASAIRTKVLYEAYPESQEEVDAILTRLGLPLSVIYDP